MGKLEFTDKNGIKTIWTGQLFRNKTAHGVGRATGGWGIFEGIYENGVANGYGRLIFRSNNYFEGTFVNGQIQGSGSYFNTKTKLKFEGLWENSILKKSRHPDEMEGFKIPEGMPPNLKNNKL